jgi:protein involved in sex pheromone biosynthesis
MVKNIRFLLIFIITGIIIFSAGMAVQKSLDGTKYNNRLHQKPEVIANQFLDRLQKAYETQNIPLLLSLYNNPTIAVDITRNDNHFCTTSRARKEITQALTGFTGIKCTFTSRQITASGDMIMIHI